MGLTEGKHQYNNISSCRLHFCFQEDGVDEEDGVDGLEDLNTIHKINIRSLWNIARDRQLRWNSRELHCIKKNHFKVLLLYGFVYIKLSQYDKTSEMEDRLGEVGWEGRVWL
jgi:hypothetical protein